MNSNLIYSLKNIATKEGDTETERIRKSVLMVTVLFKSFGCIVWTTMYYSLGFTLASTFPLAYFFVLIIATIYLYKTKQFDVALNIYTFFILIVPFFLQVAMGGFVNSGAVILWSVIAPTGALFFKGIRSGIIWFSAFMILCVISAFYKLNASQTIFVSDNTIKFFFLMNVIVICGFLLYTIAYFRELTNRQNNELELNYKSIEIQKQLVDNKNKEITDSIEYALRIQNAILPPTGLVKNCLGSCFIYYRPKDIVAGDFYWIEKLDDVVLFAACDCTGHGVPGAMVSVICHNALNRAVREFGLKQPAEILDKTAEIVIESFSKSEEDIKDGMDVSLCSYNTKTKVLQWAGANNPLWLFKNGELIETKADKQPIGMNDSRKPFTNHTFNLNTSDTIYLFSDGVTDQFGGETGNKKLTKKRFREFILSIQGKEMKEQEITLDKFITDYRKKVEQIDDMLVMGVKI
jgi:serine phosphatase RsbU (regulator of sigma subunit)